MSDYTLSLDTVTLLMDSLRSWKAANASDCMLPVLNNLVMRMLLLMQGTIWQDRVTNMRFEVCYYMCFSSCCRHSSVLRLDCDMQCAS